jgi:hypothetical protein
MCRAWREGDAEPGHRKSQQHLTGRQPVSDAGGAEHFELCRPR